jgi:RNA polymerase sigma factor (sigma-70 family)
MDERDSPPNAETSPWSVFGSDSQSIVELFELLRGKMIIFFEARRCLDPEELADETLARVMKKLCAGTEVSDLVRYSYGVARNVFHEYLRKESAKRKYVEAQQHRFGTHAEEEEPDDADDAREQRLKCQEGCLARLNEDGRRLLFEYYRFRGQPKLEHRQKMADQLNISRETLRLRVFHLKQKLKKCVKDCLENS